jgi:hypothetical protein
MNSTIPADLLELLRHEVAYPNDPPADVRGFIDQFHVGGLTTREPLDGSAHKSFVGWPSHFLIGKDGRILANEIEVSRLNEAIASAIRSQ